MRYSVIPVKTGIQSFQYLGRFWIPACAGMTTFYDFINFAIFILIFAIRNSLSPMLERAEMLKRSNF
jgi:hypothetical protein